MLQKAPNEVIYNLALIELDTAANRLKEAQERVQRLLKLYPNDYPLNQSLVDLLLKQNRSSEAEKVLDQLIKSRPNDPDVWYQIAETRGQANNIIGLHQARAEYFALVGDYDQAIQQLDLAKRRASNNFQLASRIDARQQAFIQEQEMIKQMLR